MYRSKLRRKEVWKQTIDYLLHLLLTNIIPFVVCQGEAQPSQGNNGAQRAPANPSCPPILSKKPPVLGSLLKISSKGSASQGILYTYKLLYLPPNIPPLDSSYLLIFNNTLVGQSSQL